MSEASIPAVFMRGGSSKGVFFHARDLPSSRAEQDRIFLGVLGSPDPYGRQLNGMGGGISSLSKAVIIGPPTRPDCDVDYTFAQVAVDRPIVDWSANCGNLSSAVGPFSIDEGIVKAADGEALVRIHQTNTRKVMHARFPVKGGKAVTQGDYAIAGVAGTGARVRVDILSPGGAATRDLLPTGRVIDELVVPGAGTFAASLIDASNPVAFLAAESLGLDGTELPDEIERRPDLMALLDRIRRVAGVAMGLGQTPESVGLSNPKIAWISQPGGYTTLSGEGVAAVDHDIAVRVISMERAHRAVPMTAAMCLGVAVRIKGSLPHRLASRPVRPDETRIGHPSGTLAVGAEVHFDQRWIADSAVVYRTARRLMEGRVMVTLP